MRSGQQAAEAENAAESPARERLSGGSDSRTTSRVNTVRITRSSQHQKTVRRTEPQYLGTNTGATIGASPLITAMVEKYAAAPFGETVGHDGPAQHDAGGAAMPCSSPQPDEHRHRRGQRAHPKWR